MLYRDIEKVIGKINEDISEINVYENEENFINSKFQMFLRNGEYDDNSMDLAYHYNMLKSIENDEEFYPKIHNESLQYDLEAGIMKFCLSGAE